jgi:hypothetical protein
MHTDAWRFGDDPENIEACTDCRYGMALYGRDLCATCFAREHGPDSDKDLDTEAHGHSDYDNRQRCKDAGRQA